MSALGQKRTCAAQQPMSALPPIATAKPDSRKRSCPLYPKSGHVRCNRPCLLCAKSGHLTHFGAYCISPFPKDQSSRDESTRLIQTSSFLTLARSWISSAILRKNLFLTSTDLPATQVI